MVPEIFFRIFQCVIGGSTKCLGKYRVTISVVIKTETFESKIGAINNWSAINRYKQAITMHVHLLRAMDAARWSGHLWGNSITTLPQNRAAFQQHKCPADTQRVSEGGAVCGLQTVLSLVFLPACSVERETP